MPYVRVFNGTSDYIQFNPGTATQSGYGTYLVVANVTNTATNRTLLAIRKTGSADDIDFYQKSTGTLHLYMAPSDPNGGPLPGTGSWVVLAVSKTTGTTTPRFHNYDCTTAAWTHTDATTTVADNAFTPTRFDIGAWFDSAGVASEFFIGSLYLAAYWDARALSDTTVEGLTGTSAIIAAAPTAVWVLNQQDPSVSVTELMGTGASQSAISGTSVAVSTIPHFDAVAVTSASTASLTVSAAAAGSLTVSAASANSLTLTTP